MEDKKEIIIDLAGCEIVPGSENWLSGPVTEIEMEASYISE